jgi:hypothetical protein
MGRAEGGGGHCRILEFVDGSCGLDSPSQKTIFFISIMRSGSDIANNYKQTQIIVSHGEPTIYSHC